MKKTLALALVVALGAPAFAGEEDYLQLKVYVKGMSCPTGCAPRVVKAIQGVEGAKEVKLADFDKGLFTVAFDSKTALKPAAFEKALGSYELDKMEATLTGTVARDGKSLVLTATTGAKYSLSAAPPKCCDEDKATVKKDEKKEEPKKNAKKDDCEDCATCSDPLARLESLLKENKTAVKVTGLVSQCCEETLKIAVVSVAPVEAKKATN